MVSDAIIFLAMLLVSVLLDARARPHSPSIRQWQGLLLHMLTMTVAFGLFLALSGSMPLAAVLAAALMALLVIGTNAKYAMLGEPLVFSDFALIAALFRHPRFYFTAITLRQRWMMLVGGVLLLCLAGLFVPRIEPHLAGLALSLSGLACLVALCASGALLNMAPVPDLEADVARYGLIATLLIYWRRWQETLDPPICAGALQTKVPGPDIILIVQCESFADPVDLTGDHRLALPGLARARRMAVQSGNLNVSGFGAYTMRTEYGVLFGRSEAELGFRRFDPFLTAAHETSYALPARLAGRDFRSVFVHPHDMSFYGRDRLMPACGFAELVGEEDLAAVRSTSHRYVDDRALGKVIGDLVESAAGPSLIYAVTMENHGPWATSNRSGSEAGLQAYLAHLRSSDAMLSDLIDRLGNIGRSSLLVFFGDHRPSIPGVTDPFGDRHTPYVMLRFSGEGLIEGDGGSVDLTPDGLHHAILDFFR